MASAGTVTVDFAAETAKFTSELKRVNQSIDSFGAGLNSLSNIAKTAFAAFSIVAVVNQIENAISKSLELGEAISDASKKAGVASGAFSELTFAAKLANVEIGDLSSAFKFLQVGIAKGGKEVESLGVNLQVLKSLQPDRQFEVVAEAIAQIDDPAIRAAAAVEVFGKAGANLLPLLTDGAKGIRAAREEAQRVGASLSTEQVDKLAEAKDSVDKLKLAYEGFAASLTSTVADSITKVFNKLTDITSGAKASPAQKLMDIVAELDEDIASRSTKQVGRAIIQGEDPNEAPRRLRGGTPANLSAALETRAALLEKIGQLERDQKRIDDQAAAVTATAVVPANRTFGNQAVAAETARAAMQAKLQSDIDGFNAQISAQTEEFLQSDLQKTIDHEARKTGAIFDEIDRRSEAEQRVREVSEALEEQAEQRKMQLREQATDLFIDSLAIIGASNKKFAKLQKLANIAEATRNTFVAITKALSSAPPPYNFALAALVGAAGLAQVAKIRSTPDIGDSGGGGGFGGGVSIGTQPTSPFDPNQTQNITPQAQPAVVQFVVNGNFYANEQAQREFIDALTDYMSNDGMVIPRNSSQAAMFMPAQ